MVLYVHSGPWARNIRGYNPTVQWFANRGYVCLQVNFRGSAGYGKDFLRSGNKEWGGKMQDDLIDSVNWAIENKIADPARIAICGADYGGYAALVGVTFTPDLFCCGSAIGSPSNLLTFIQPDTTFWKKNAFRTLFKRIGHPDIDRDLLISRSPLYKIDNIKSPLLIAHGLNDQRVKSIESYQIVMAMKRKGIDVEYIVFPDEGGMINKLKNRLKFYSVLEKFLSRHLGGRYEEREIQIEETIKPLNNDNILNEKVLIDKILREEDKEAFENLLEAYKKPLLKHLFKMTGDSDVSMELLYETFSRVWIYLDSYNFDMSFFSWVFTIASNVAKKHRIKESNFIYDINLEEIDLDIMPHGWEQSVENKCLIKSMFDSLSEEYKTAVILRFMEDMEYKEIATLMNKTPRQIKNYLYRARKSLLQFWINTKE